MDISVIICTYNRSKNLEGVLHSLTQMNPPPDIGWEIIVVDNNSNDNTREVVGRFVKSRLDIKYIFEPQQGLSHARNRGIREATGHVLSFIDDDVLVDKNWLLEVKKAFDHYQPACVGGRVPLHQDLITPEWWHKDYDNAIGACDKGEKVIVADMKYLGHIGIGANLSFKRSCFEKYGDFMIDLGRIGSSLLMGEEAEFCNRLRTNGELLIYYPAAIVYQCPPADRITKSYLQRWFFRIGEWLYVQDGLYEINTRNKVPIIFGVPRWMYKVAIMDGLSLLYSYSTGRQIEGFYKLVQLSTFFGYSIGAFKHTVFGRKQSRQFIP